MPENVNTFAVAGCSQLVTLRGPARPRRGEEVRELGIIEDGASDNITRSKFGFDARDILHPFLKPFGLGAGRGERTPYAAIGVASTAD